MRSHGPRSTSFDNITEMQNMLVQPNDYAGAYCGIYCLYGLLRFNGIEVDIENMLKVEYIESKKGSSLASLVRCAQEQGTPAIALKNLTTNDLRHLPVPAILNVKRYPGAKMYDHYELFLGNENDLFRVYDPPNTSRLVPAEELAARWRGRCVVALSDPIRVTTFLHRRQYKFWRLAGVWLLLIMGFRLAAARGKIAKPTKVCMRSCFLRSLLQLCVICSVSTLVGLLYHVFRDDGLLCQTQPIAAIQTAHIGGFLPVLEAEQVSSLLHNQNVAIVDVRYERDYERGHIPGSINLPVYSESSFPALSEIPKTARIVVYCQSNECPFTEHVAGQLYRDGFTNLALFREGWIGWQEWIAGEAEALEEPST